LTRRAFERGAGGASSFSRNSGIVDVWVKRADKLKIIEHPCHPCQSCHRKLSFFDYSCSQIGQRFRKWFWFNNFQTWAGLDLTNSAPELPLFGTTKPLFVTKLSLFGTELPLVVANKPLFETELSFSAATKPFSVMDKPLFEANKPLIVMKLPWFGTQSPTGERVTPCAPQ